MNIEIQNEDLEFCFLLVFKKKYEETENCYRKNRRKRKRKKNIYENCKWWKPAQTDLSTKIWSSQTVKWKRMMPFMAGKAKENEIHTHTHDKKKLTAKYFVLRLNHSSRNVNLWYCFYSKIFLFVFFVIVVVVAVRSAFRIIFSVLVRWSQQIRAIEPKESNINSKKRKKNLWRKTEHIHNVHIT